MILFYVSFHFSVFYRIFNKMNLFCFWPKSTKSREKYIKFGLKADVDFLLSKEGNPKMCALQCVSNWQLHLNVVLLIWDSTDWCRFNLDQLSAILLTYLFYLGDVVCVCECVSVHLILKATAGIKWVSTFLTAVATINKAKNSFKETRTKRQ